MKKIVRVGLISEFQADLCGLVCKFAFFGMLLSMCGIANAQYDSRNSLPKVFTVSPHGVNIQTGRLMLERHDLQIGSLTFTRYYGADLPLLDSNLHVLGQAQASSLGAFGWSHVFNEGIYSGNCVQTNAPACSSSSLVSYYEVVVHGSKYWFTLDNRNGLTSPGNTNSNGMSLTLVGANYFFVDRSGDTYTFTNYPSGSPSYLLNSNTSWPNQALQSVVYANGRRRDYYYNASGRLSLVSSSDGYALAFDYDGFGNIAHACGYNLAKNAVNSSTGCAGATLKVTYSYDGSGNVLTAVTDPLGHVESYRNATATYTTGGAASGTSYLGCFTIPDSSQCKLTMSYGIQSEDSYSGSVDPNYFGTDQVRTQVSADGQIWQYRYQNSQPAPGTGPHTYVGSPAWYQSGMSYSYMTDPLGNQQSVAYNFGLAVSMNNAAGSEIYKYNGDTPVLYTSHEGFSIYRILDGRQNEIQVYKFPKGSGTLMAYSSLQPASVIPLTCCFQGAVDPIPSGSILANNDTYPADAWTGNSITGCNAASAKLCDKPTARIDANGRETDFTYDAAHGGVLTETAPADANGVRPQKRYTYAQFTAAYYNGAGALAQGPSVWLVTRISECRTTASCAGTADESVTTFRYEPANLQLAAKTLAAGDGSVSLTVTYSYDDQGNKLTETDALGNVTRWRYDLMHRLVGEVSPVPGNGQPNRATRNTYDASGNLVRSETGTVADQSDGSWAAFNSLEEVDAIYDAMDRKIQESKSAAGTTYELTQYSYDAVGRLDCTALRMNQAAFASLPGACSLGSQGSAGPDRITRNSYDAIGRLLKITKAYGTPLQQDYATYTYTPDSKQASVTDANGNLATMAYDGFDRQVQWTFPSPSTPGQVNTADYEQYGYDANGNRTSLRKRDGRVWTFTYDALNRVSTKSLGTTTCALSCTAAPSAALRSVFYGYDLQGRQLYARFDSASGSDGVVSSYNGLGELTASTTTMGGFGKTLAYQYDAAGNRTRVTHPDGVYFSSRYDGLNRLSGASWTTAGGTTPFLTIGYDALGRRASITRGSSATGYAYDGIDRLSGQSQTFAGGSGNLTVTLGYNPASQITSQIRDNDAYAWTGAVTVDRAYASNGLNQYTSAGPASFSYDADGNLTGDGTNSYVYDAENRLVGMNGTVLTYDPDGRLQRVQTSAATTRFLYDGDALAAEYDGAGNLLRRYMFAGEDEPILEDAGGALNCSGTRFLATDHQGSIVAQVDCGGNRKAINSYDEYGIPATGNTGRFQYTGQAWMPELGMYYYKARMYSPTLGRFMQTDPVGYKDQVNLYTYVANDPINKTDPSGEESACFSNNNCGQPTDARTAAIGLGGFLTIGVTLAAAPEAIIATASMVAAKVAAFGERKALNGLKRLWANDNVPKASQIERWSERSGLRKVAEDGKPLKYYDKNGINRMTVKEGSPRTPGSEKPHVEVRNSRGDRIDPLTGDPTSKRSLGNHRPVDISN